MFAQNIMSFQRGVHNPKSNGEFTLFLKKEHRTTVEHSKFKHRIYKVLVSLFHSVSVSLSVSLSVCISVSLYLCLCLCLSQTLCHSIVAYKCRMLKCYI